MQYIDFHTHQTKQNRNIQIRNIFAQNLRHSTPEFLFSAGLHPWHIGKVNPGECFIAMESSAMQVNMLAIGECGLDRSISTDFALQEKYFFEQIKIAEEHCKPLIIHCVRAYSDLLRIKKEMKSDIPWIIHGYRANLETTLNLLSRGFYFSVGEKLLKDVAKQDILKTIPLERLFLETDDSEIPIQKIYLFAAQILKIDEELLAEAIHNNFKTLFGDDKLAAKN